MLARRTPMKRANPRRRRARHRRDFGARAPVVREMPCLAASDTCSGPIEAAHARSRGAGGDRRHLVPLCSAHHREQHTVGVRTFQKSYDLDLLAEAARIAAELDARGLE